MAKEAHRKLAAIMFADIVSYSRMMGSNEGEALKLVKDFESISAKIIEEYNGFDTLCLQDTPWPPMASSASKMPHRCLPDDPQMMIDDER